MAEPRPTPGPTLACRDLVVGYDRAPVIQELSLTIPAGQVTVLVGSNGSGKSTLLRTLARLLKPRGGTVLLDGAPITTLPTREVAKRLSMLPQGPIAPEGLTIRQLVAQGRYPHQGWLRQWSEQDERLTREALDATDLHDLADRPLDALSGGQRQRAWIAMTLAQDTPILLLDEPTTFLDVAHQLDVLDLLRDLNRRRGRTIVMVLHDLNQAARYADYLVALRDGRIVAEGAPADVITETIVRDVFDLESRIVVDPVSGAPLCIPIGRRRSEHQPAESPANDTSQPPHDPTANASQPRSHQTAGARR
jgi:iron complex transport system ATP-binding protein